MISAIDVDDVLQRRSIRVLIETLAHFEWKMQLKRTEFLIASASCKKSKWKDSVSYLNYLLSVRLLGFTEKNCGSNDLLLVRSLLRELSPWAKPAFMF